MNKQKESKVISKESITKDLNDLENSFAKEVKEAKDLDMIEAVRVKYLGRKSLLNQILRGIKDLSSEDKKEIGQKSNKLKSQMSEVLDQRKTKFQNEFIAKQDQEWHDVTIPGIDPKSGTIHPTTQMRWRVEEIFQKMGFEVIDPYELDDDYHTFTSLNIPEGHPARDMWDTFWTTDNHIPITHTSAMQNRIIKNSEPPIRAIVPGKCFRNEATDASHEHTFYQVEGIYIDKGITFTDMIGTLQEFLRNYFDKEVEMGASIFSKSSNKIETRIQPSFFPFVEPAIEIMIKWKVGGADKWLEVIPCGPIHPQVLTEGGLNPDVYSGFAWGFGLDRLVMIKYEVEDIRHFHGGDLRFLKQFK